MFSHKIQATIDHIKGAITTFWGHLTGNEGHKEKGRQMRFFAKNRAKYGLTKEESKARVSKFVEESHTAGSHTFSH